MLMDDKKRSQLLSQNDSLSEVDRLLTELVPPHENPRTSVGVNESHLTEDKAKRPSTDKIQQKRTGIDKDKRVPNFIEGYEQEE